MPVSVDEKDPWAVVAVGEPVQDDPWAVVSIGEETPQDDPWGVVSVGEQTSITDSLKSGLEKVNQYGLGFAKTVGDVNKRIVGAAEGLGTIVSGAGAFIPSIAAGAGEIAKQVMEQGPENIPNYLGPSKTYNEKPIDFKPAIKQQQAVQEALTLQPQTETGQAVAAAASLPFEKYHEIIRKFAPEGEEAKYQFIGDLALLGIPAVVKGIKSGIQYIPEIKDTNFYRRMTIKERGLVALSPEESAARLSALYDELKAKGMTDAELAKSADAFKQEALRRRSTPEKQAFTVEDQLKAKQPEVYAQLKKEAQDAEGLQKDVGQVSEGGIAKEAGKAEGSTNLEQQAPGQPGGQGLEQEEIKLKATDRRQDIETRKMVAEMSTEEMQSALLTDELTGLKNKRAYTEAEKKLVQVKSDVDSLKWVNDNLGADAGDALLKAKADALRAEGVDAYRTGGDEYYSQFDSPEQVDAVMKNVAKRVKSAIIEAEKKDGTIGKYTNAWGFSYGIGRDAKSADAALRAAKEIRRGTGERADRGVEPPGLVEVDEGQRPNRPGDKAESNIPAREVTEKRKPIELNKSQRQTLETVKTEIEQGEPARRQVARDELTGKVTTVFVEGGTYPDYFKGKGYTKKDALNAINKALNNQPLTENQKIIVEDLNRGFRRQATDVLISEHEKKIAPLKTAWDLKEGDKFKIEGEGFKVTDVNQEGLLPEITVKDGKTYTIKGDEKIQYDKGSFKSAKPETTGGAATADTGQYTKTERQAIELPEIVELAKELMEGKFPYIKQKLRLMQGMARGVFHPKKGNIGLRADIFKDAHEAKRVLAHEIGHLVDWLPDKYIQRGNLLGRIATLKRYMSNTYGDIIDAPYKGLMSNFKIRDELKALTQIIKPFDEKASRKFTKYRYSSKELYADAFSTLINDPALLKKTAPNFYQGLFDYFDRKPDVKAVYDEIQKRIKDKGAVIAERDVKSREMSQKGEKIREAKEQKEPAALTKLGKALKKALIDENTELISRLKKAKKEGLRYKLEEKAYIPSEILAYRNRIDEGVINPLEKNGVTIEDVGEYVKYRRIATERADIANPLGHTKETAEKQLALLKAKLGDAKYAELEAGVKKFWEIRKSAVISLLKEADMYSDALMKKIEDNENYATFNVLDAMEKEFGRGVSGHIYKQIGTLHEIENPFVATVLKDASLIRAARMNNIKKDITKFLRDVDGSLKDADTRFNGKYQEPVEPRDPNTGLLTYMEKGKIKAYYAPKEIADTFKYDPQQANIITKIWQVVHAPVRSVLVSHNPIWMVRNVVRDFLGTIKHIPGMTAPKLFGYYGSTIKEAARSAFLGEKTENIQKMLKDRMIVPDRQFEAKDISTDAQIDRIMEKVGDSPVRYRNFVVKPFVKLWDYLGRMGQFTERWAKLSGYKYLKDVQAKEGLTEGRIGHLVRTRVGTPDVYRRGSLNTITNNVFLFSNVSKEGWRASYEAAKENPAEYTWKTIKFNAIPKMILYAGLAGAFGNEIKKILEGISDYDKENYVIVPLGKTREGKSVFFRIPQDYTGQVVGALTWDLLNGRIAGKKGAISEIASQHPYQWSPVIEVAGDAAQYALHGLNPYDEYFGGFVLDETVYKAGGARAWEDIAKYSAKQLGAKAIYDFKGTSVKEVEGEMEKALKYPGMSVLGTFLKVSDLGHKEQLREVKQGAEKEIATKQLAVRDRMIKSINAATDEGRKPGVRDAVELYKELKKDGLIDPLSISVAQFRRRYDRYASKAKNNIEIDAVINAATNEERAALLKHYKETMGEDGYRDILRQLAREGFNPRGAMLKMRLSERQAEMEAGNGE